MTFIDVNNGDHRIIDRLKIGRTTLAIDSKSLQIGEKNNKLTYRLYIQTSILYRRT